MDERLKQSPAFAELTDAQLAHIVALGREVTFPKDAIIIQEGAQSRGMYVLLDGELIVTKHIRGRSVTLSRLEPVTFVGEISVMTGFDHMATVRAVTDARLLFYDVALFRAIFEDSPLLRILLSTTAERLRRMEAAVRQEEKLTALGRLSAGLAHELNNPAAASVRAAKQLPAVLSALQKLVFQLSEFGLTTGQLSFLDERQGQLMARAAQPDTLAPLERADREDELAAWMDAHGIDNGWQLAPMFVRAQIMVGELDEIRTMLGDRALRTALAWLEGVLNVVSMLTTIEQSAERIHSLVTAIKAYSYMDQSPVQEIDIHQGLENTLAILAHKLKNITVVREYDRSMPRVTAYGSLLNQVWTNLLDNAIDALKGSGTIWIRTAFEHDHVTVEIADNGPGIPPEVQSRIFEPFFTTKGIGDGTGMGLDIAYRIVVEDHRGDLQVTSQPGDTRFQVCLPLQPNGE